MIISGEAISTTLYYDRLFECEAAKIGPGEYYFTKKDMVIVTVVGSCIAACIRDKNIGIGGMNHFMLPSNISEGSEGPFSQSVRYGTYAMEVLLNQLFKNGARRENLEVKIFGGGSVLPNMKSLNVGGRNVDFIRSYLQDEGIAIASEDLSDVYPRKVYFFQKTGKVMVKKLRDNSRSKLVAREDDYAKRIKAAAIGGDVELF